MLCPVCGSDTAAGLPRCARCHAALPGSGEPTREDPQGGTPWPVPEDDDRMPWPNPAFPPYAPDPLQQRRKRRSGYVGWILTGVLGLAVAAAVIVLWPGREPARERPAARNSPQASQAPGAGGSPAGPPESGPPAAQRKYWVDTFAAADGFREPGTSGEPAGRLRKGTNYVFCKRWGGRVERNDQYNHWWLLTNLDEVYSGGGARAYVPALYLTHWGNDEAKDNSGQEIPTCPS